VATTVGGVYLGGMKQDWVFVGEKAKAFSDDNGPIGWVRSPSACRTHALVIHGTLVLVTVPLGIMWAATILSYIHEVGSRFWNSIADVPNEEDEGTVAPVIEREVPESDHENIQEIRKLKRWLFINLYYCQ